MANMGDKFFNLGMMIGNGIAARQREAELTKAFRKAFGLDGNSDTAGNNAQQNQQTERRVENPVRLVRPALAKPDAGPRRAAKSDQIRERLHDERDGKHDPERGQRVHTGAIDPRDIHSIDDVV